MSKALTLMEQIALKKKQLTNAKGTVSLKGGSKNQFRLLPGWDGEGTIFYQDFSLHWVKRVGETKPSAVHMCMMKTLGEHCPICDALAVGSRVAEDEQQGEALKESGSKPRMLFNVLRKGETEPVILDVPGGVAAEILGLMEEWGDVTHPVTGRDIIIDATGAGKQTRYSVGPASKESPLPASIYDVENPEAYDVQNLAEHVQQQDPAKLAACIAEIEGITGIASTASPALAGSGSTAPAALLPESEFDADLLLEEQEAGLAEVTAEPVDADEVSAKRAAAKAEYAKALADAERG